MLRLSDFFIFTELMRMKKAKDEWNSKTVFEKLWWFLKMKYRLYKSGVYQIYFAMSTIFEIGPAVSNEQVQNDEL